MRVMQVLMIESAVRGVLLVNGQFCGPLGEEGQAFPASPDAEVYMQLFPFDPAIPPLTAALRLSGGAVEALLPERNAYAVLWPDGVVQLELRPASGGGEGQAQGETQTAAAGVLLRYLTLRLAGSPDADVLLLRAQDAPSLPPYDAVVPLRFAPLAASERYDERAGLVRRLAPNVARVDAALAATVPAGQGQRLIERLTVMESRPPQAGNMSAV